MEALKKGEIDIDTLVNYVSEVISKESGNILGDAQKSMVLSRLNKRLIDLGALDPQSYYEYLQENYKKEVSILVSLLTTHHTFFFREFVHFEFIQDYLPIMVEKIKKRGDSKLKVLSLACSKGHEVYSLAMFLDSNKELLQGLEYEVTGTDIDPECIEMAKNGVYSFKEVKTIPTKFLNGNWKKGTGEIANFAKIKNHLMEKCNFFVSNLLDTQNFNEKFDLILCRNVFIYFNNKDIEKIVSNFKNFIFEDGVFITGLSESLKNLSLDLSTLGPNVYSFSKQNNFKNTTTPKDTPYPIKMLIVDDSPVVLKILTKIFTEDSEFEVVGTAKNGVEAQEFLKHNKVDAMTLDIHMPEMDGVEYLRLNYNLKHPKVVVVSSASRDDMRYAKAVFDYGASDFVEKPALSNVLDSAIEIKNKIKLAFVQQNKNVKETVFNFQKHEIKNCHNKARVVICSINDIKKLNKIINELEGDQPPLFVFLTGNTSLVDIFNEKINSLYDIEELKDQNEFSNETIYFGSMSNSFDKTIELISNKTISFNIFGIIPQKNLRKIIKLRDKQILLEDFGEEFKIDLNGIDDCFPFTSFFHIGTEFFSKKD